MHALCYNFLIKLYTGYTQYFINPKLSFTEKERHLYFKRDAVYVILYALAVLN